MALKIIDAKKSGFPHDGRFGCVHLIFDRDIDADPLRVSIFKLLGREYLARSTPPKANWTPARSHFFDASPVLRGAGQTVFSLGPEVTTFIPDESMLEIASEDNLIRETAVWSGVSVDFTWPGPPPEPAVRPAPKPPQPQPPKAPAPPPEPPVEPVAITSRPEEAKVIEPPPPPDPPPQAVPPNPPAPPAKRGLRAGMLALGVLVAGAIGAVVWGTQHRDYLCDHFHLFCDPEVLAYHQAKDCAAPKACGVSEACLANYRNTYPNGRFSAELDDIAIKKGRPCPTDTAPPAPAIDQEKVAYDHVVACTSSVTCGASACAADYRQSFANGTHRADVDRIVSQKDAACRAEATEKEVYDQAVGCARPRTCGALECIADYRRSYPNGRYKAQIDQIAQSPSAAACVDREKVEFDQADACARSKSCGALDCLAPYRRDYPNGRFKAQIDQIAQQISQQPKAQACPDLDREAYDRAEKCSQPLQCGANHCLIEYRRDFPNGNYRSLIEQIGATKGPDCPIRPTLPQDTTPDNTSSLPPFLRRTNEDPRMDCGKARVPIEQMICADGDMARFNGDLQRAYDSRRATLPPSGRDRLKQEERDWIDQRNSSCNAPPSGTWSETDLRKLKNRFIEKAQARTNELQR